MKTVNGSFKKKRNVLLVAGVMAFSMLFTGCGKSKNDEEKPASESEAVSSSDVQKEVLSFVGEKLPAISANRDKAIEVYNKAVADNLKSDEMLMNLKDTAIPALQAYIDELDAIEINSEEVKALKDLTRQSVEKQYSAMKMVVTAIEDSNPEYLSQAQNLIDEAYETLDKYNDKLKTICSDQGIQLTME